MVPRAAGGGKGGGALWRAKPAAVTGPDRDQSDPRRRTYLDDRRDGPIATVEKGEKAPAARGSARQRASEQTNDDASHTRRGSSSPRDDRARVGHRLNDLIVERGDYPGNAKSPAATRVMVGRKVGGDGATIMIARSLQAGDAGNGVSGRILGLAAPTTSSDLRVQA